MFVETVITECDFSGNRYPGGIAGAGALAQGATGRWCVVMWFGPEYLEEKGIVPLTHDQAVAKCLEIGGSIDF